MSERGPDGGSGPSSASLGCAPGGAPPVEPLAPGPVHAAARWGFWGTVAWGLGIGLVFALVQTAVLLGALVGKHGTGDALARSLAHPGSEGTALSLAILGSAVACTGLVVLAVRARRGSSLRAYLALAPTSWRSLGAWLGVLAGFVALADLVARLLHHETSGGLMAEAYASARPLWLLWVAVVVGAPVFEEVFFRGFLYEGLAATRLGAPGAVLATSAVFAVIHLQYAAFEMGVIFCLGLVLGAARARTRSLVVPLALHATNNLVATLALHFG